MAASSEPTRRRRYTRAPEHGPLTLTPRKRRLLAHVADFGLASLPQLAALAELSPKSARRHLRELFDHGLVEVLSVARFALAEAVGAANETHLFGSAPNIYTPTRAGLRVLRRLGWEGEDPPLGLGRNRRPTFLAHELAIREARVWLELAARRVPGQRLERWRDGSAAEIPLGRPRPPKVVRPDAWFVYRLGEPVLVGLLEIDRGTERGSRRWQEKVAAYQALFQGGQLREVTGYVNARVLVIVPNERRRDRLAELLTRLAEPSLARRYWLAERAVLETPDFTVPAWRQPGSKLLRPLIPPNLAGTAPDHKE